MTHPVTPAVDGSATVYCDGLFGTPSGKTAHGLVRFSRRYHIKSVIDARHAGKDALEVLDGRPGGIPVVRNFQEAMERERAWGNRLTHFVIGIAPDGGRLPAEARPVVLAALEAGLNVDSGLHDFLGDDREFAAVARAKGVVIRDVRKTPGRKDLHFFTGRIEEVDAFRIAVLGTDSAVGKRTTAWLIVEELRRRGIPSELVGTGQTAWLQGARYSLILDSLINDFVSGEIEHAAWSAWKEGGARAIVLEGQGSLLNPAYPGGFELLAAGRPHAVVVQHAPARQDYDGFPGFPIHPIERQIEALEIVGGKPVVALTLNHEGLTGEEIPAACEELRRRTGRPTFDVLRDGASGLVETLLDWRKHGAEQGS